MLYKIFTKSIFEVFIQEDLIQSFSYTFVSLNNRDGPDIWFLGLAGYPAHLLSGSSLLNILIILIVIMGLMKQNKEIYTK